MSIPNHLFPQRYQRYWRYWPAVASLLSGTLLALCYQPWGIGSLVWFWMMPLLAALWFSPERSGKSRWKQGFQLGYLSGFLFFALNVSWITRVSLVAGTWLAGFAAWMFLTAYLALYFGAFGAFAATLGRWNPATDDPSAPKTKRTLFGQSFAVLRISFLNAAAWGGLEWLRGVLFSGFGWNGLGVALRDQLVLVQFADVIGITGYGFVLSFAGIVFFCTAIRLILEIRSRQRIRPHLDLSVALAMIAGIVLYGLTAFTTPQGKTVSLRVRLMQMNVPQNEKWSEDLTVRQKVIFDYRDLTRAFVKTDPPDLVVWPETSIPGLFSAPWVHEYLNDSILKGENFYLATGIEDTELETPDSYNTLTLLRGNTQSYQMYRKTHLVPFGEYIPFRRTFPFLSQITGGVVDAGFTAGTSYEPLILEKEGHQIGLIPLICFEDTIPALARRFLREGPQVFINVTNDGWFDGSAEPWQHFENAIFRCIEYRRPMIRCANTGVSAYIDEYGSLYDRSGRESQPRILRDPITGSTSIRGSLPATLAVPLDPPRTIYAVIGDSFSIAMGLIALIAAILRIITHRRKPTPHDQEDSPNPESFQTREI